MILHTTHDSAVTIPNVNPHFMVTNLLKQQIFLHDNDTYNYSYVCTLVSESVLAICFVWLVVTWLPVLLNWIDSCCPTYSEH